MGSELSGIKVGDETEHIVNLYLFMYYFYINKLAHIARLILYFSKITNSYILEIDSRSEIAKGE